MKMVFFLIFLMKNKELYHFSLCLQEKQIKILIKSFLNINIDEKSVFVPHITRQMNNSLLSNRIKLNEKFL